MADLRFQVTIEDVSTKKSKDGPLTTILLRVDDAMPSHIGRLAGHVGKGATITVSPFQQELPLYEPDAMQGELWTVAPARTVPAPEPSAEQPTEDAPAEATEPAPAIIWARGGKHVWHALDARGKPTGLAIIWCESWEDHEHEEGINGVWIANFPDGREQPVSNLGVDPADEAIRLQAQAEAGELAFGEGPEHPIEDAPPTPPIAWRHTGQQRYAAQNAAAQLLRVNLFWISSWADGDTGEVFENLWVAQDCREGQHAELSPVGLVGVLPDDEPGLATAQAAAVALLWPSPTNEAIVAECEEIAAQADADGGETEEPLCLEAKITPEPVGSAEVPEGEDPEVTELAELFGRPLPSNSFADVPIEAALLPRVPRRRAAR